MGKGAQTKKGPWRPGRRGRGAARESLRIGHRPWGTQGGPRGGRRGGDPHAPKASPGVIRGAPGGEEEEVPGDQV